MNKSLKYPPNHIPILHKKCKIMNIIVQNTIDKAYDINKKYKIFYIRLSIYLMVQATFVS